MITQRVQYKLAVRVHRCLRHRAPCYLADYTVCQPTAVPGTSETGHGPLDRFPTFLVASICDLPDVINCQFREFSAALLGPVHFLLPDQQPGIHCLIICAIQLLTPNNLGGTWKCSPGIRSVSALEVLRNRALQYLLTYTDHTIIHEDHVESIQQV